VRESDLSSRYRQGGQNRNKNRDAVFEMLSEKEMSIEIPFLPPAECSPNSRNFWAGKHKAGRVYHDAVFYYCVDARNRGYSQGMSLPFTKARLNLTFVFPQHRRRDQDNLLARFKPGLDGIVDAALLLDDDAEHLEIGEVDIVVDPERAPLTIIDIEGAADRG